MKNGKFDYYCENCGRMLRDVCKLCKERINNTPTMFRAKS